MAAIVYDIEANGLKETITKVWCLSAGPLDTEEIYSWDSEKDNIEEGLAYLDQATELICHNQINFDLPVLKSFYNWEPKSHVQITDTLVISRLSNPDRRKPLGYTSKDGPHSLGAWGYRVCRAKPSHEDWSVYSAAMLQRNREDVAINKLTRHLLSAEMSGYDWSESWGIEHRINEVVTEQEIYGVYFNIAQAKHLVTELSTNVELLDADLLPRLPIKYVMQGTVPVNKPFLNSGQYAKMTTNWYPELLDSKLLRFVGGPFTRLNAVKLDINSNKQVKDYLLSQGWIPTEYNYSKKTGERTSPKLTEDSFDTIQGNTGELIKKRIIYCHRRGVIEGWLNRVRPDSRLSACANTCGTNTGRMTHSNVANVPKALEKVPYGIAMRELFCAPEGYVLVGCDAAQIELRILAHYMGDEAYIEAILHDDIHVYNQNLAGLPDRDSAKTFIYAFIYGSGNYLLGIIVGGDEKDGARLRKSFLNGLPLLKKLITKVKRAANKGWLKGLDGRKLFLRRDEDTGEIIKHKALNLLLQAGGSIVMKKAAIIARDLIKEEGLDAREVLNIHDELQYECSKKDSKRCAELLEQSLVLAGEYFNLKCPMAGEAKIGSTWAETH